MNLNELSEQLLYQFQSESDLVKAIEQLSENFTLRREKIEQYLDDPRLVSAYTMFYLSTNIPKLAVVLDYIDKKFIDFTDYEIIDIGSGPGTFVLGFLAQLPHNRYVGIETSALMREQASKLTQHFYPAANVKYIEHPKLVSSKKQKRLGLFSHSANEMEVSAVESYIKQLELDEVLFIEPGTKEFFQKSLQIRKILQQSSFQIAYPCPSQNPCPLKGEDWCHQFINVTLAPDLQRLCQLVKKDRSLLPLTIHYFVNTKLSDQSELKRVIRVYPPSKFAIEMEACQLEENSNKVYRLQQLTRGLSKQEIKLLSQIKAGQKISFKPIKEIAPFFIRGEVHES